MSKSASDLFIVDNGDAGWKVSRYLAEWCGYSKAVDIATGFFEIGGLLTLDGAWQTVPAIRILMGDEVSKRTRKAFDEGLADISQRLDRSIESRKAKDDFLTGVPAIVEALRTGRIQCRVYRKDKFHAKAYITHAEREVIGSAALVGSSNLTAPGLRDNVELNVQITGAQVTALQEWYERHWCEAEDGTPRILRVIAHHTKERTPFEVWAKALYEFARDRRPSPGTARPFSATAWGSGRRTSASCSSSAGLPITAGGSCSSRRKPPRKRCGSRCWRTSCPPASPRTRPPGRRDAASAPTRADGVALDADVGAGTGGTGGGHGGTSHLLGI